MDDRRKLLGGRIRDARIRLSYTQDQLAKESGLSSPQIISQIEKGERDLKAWELFTIAKALYLEISELLSEESSLAINVLWRQAPASGREIIEAEFLRRCQQYALVEKLCECTIEKVLPVYDDVDLTTMSYDEANRLGERLWEELNLGNRPAYSLRSLLEDDYGVKIWCKNLGDDGSAAAAKGPFGAAIFINSEEAPWRRNFSIGHELFHLMTWTQTIEIGILNDKVEKLANAFSSALLLPTKPLKEALEARIKEGEVDNADFIEIARQFDVSTSALAYRLINLKFVNRDQMEKLLETLPFKSLDRTYRMGTWSQPPAIPERFVRLSFLAYQKGNLSRSKLADFFNVSIADLKEKLSEYGLDEEFDYQAKVCAT